jgi:RhtB (resistance to homoserine/threonine) family protein
MTLTQSLLTFTVAAALLAATPGVDTALVLRALVTHGARRAVQAALGIAAGCLVWGAVVALGLGALLTASTLAFNVVKVVGAAYLIWQGIRLLRRPAASAQSQASTQPFTPPAAAGSAFLQGFLTNVLNPKVGVFYVTLLPQFVVADVPAGPYIFALASIHVGLSVLWFFLLIGAARHLQRWLSRPRVQTIMDRITGLVFVAFGLKLVAAQPH